MLKMKINDVEVVAAEGEHVIDVARRNGFAIPSLCHHPAVTSIGACRVCLVEVVQNGKSSLSTSCNMPATEGLEITTDSPLIRESRAMNLELLLARAPTVAALREIAAKYGVNRTRFEPPEAAGVANCILCELCNRVCDALGHRALSTVGRGDRKKVGPPFGEPNPDCVGCGACASVCPTGCVYMKDTAATRMIWGKSFRFVPCSACGAPVMTEEHMKDAIARTGLPADYFGVCDKCRQGAAAAKFAGVVW
ncbi:MAG: 2Fe-2S iron-sulfur cluster-binding protein [Myxococcota bacterium]|jgi:NADH dehydrogenase/NADH:ubiquinone oxidoreductase subunit G